MKAVLRELWRGVTVLMLVFLFGAATVQSVYEAAIADDITAIAYGILAWVFAAGTLLLVWFIGAQCGQDPA